MSEVYSTPYILIFGFILLHSCRKKLGNQIDIERNSSKALRGFLALLILTVHFLDKNIHITTEIDRAFVASGFLCVSGFFIFSGYGLYVSYTSKKDYLNNFGIKTFIKLYVPFSICNIVYYLYHIVTGKIEFSATNFILSFFSNFNTDNSWYVFVIFACYIIFFVTFANSITVNKKVLLFCIGVVSFTLLQILTFNEFYVSSTFEYLRNFHSTLVIIIGLLYAHYSKKVQTPKIRYYPILICSLLLFVVFYEWNYISYRFTITSLFGYEKMVASLLFGNLFVWICIKFDFSKNDLLQKLGGYRMRYTSFMVCL